MDRFQTYVQNDLGLNTVANFSIGVDPQGLEGQGDNSHYLPGSKKIAFGRRNGTAGSDFNPVPDAADAMVILHEYGHAIQDNQLPGFSGFGGGVGEGHGDFLAAVYYDDKHATPANTRGVMMNFDANTTDNGWSGRRYDKATRFDDAAFTSAGGYGRAEIWASAMFELYRKLGGDSVYPWVKSAARDLAIRLHLMANANVPTSGSTVSDFAGQVLALDGNLGGWRYANGLHKKVISEVFTKRHAAGFTALPADVFINDGRKGGYGSISGNDLFTEKQFLDNYWSTQDLWVTVAPYASASDQQNGDPGDHVEPPVGSTANLYVRVKNKGTTGSGSGHVLPASRHFCALGPSASSPSRIPCRRVGRRGSGRSAGPLRSSTTSACSPSPRPRPTTRSSTSTPGLSGTTCSSGSTTTSASATSRRRWRCPRGRSGSRSRSAADWHGRRTTGWSTRPRCRLARSSRRPCRPRSSPARR